MTTSYRRSPRFTSRRKEDAALCNTPIPGDTQQELHRRSERLLHQFRDKMRSLHYALATEKSYRHWIVEFLRFHRMSDEWRHPTEMGKTEIEAFLTHLAVDKLSLQAVSTK